MMEELMIKFLEGKCSQQEIEMLRNDAVIWEELQQIQKVDSVFSKYQYETPSPLLNDRILIQLQTKDSSRSLDWKDFILPILFMLGSVIYFVLNKGTLTSGEISWLELPLGNSSIVIFLASMCLLSLVVLDQMLQKKAGKAHFFMSVA